MKISHYLYNAFIIENGRTKLAIDPGQNLWFLKLRSLIPKPEWENVTHVLVTHGDPDHYKFAVEMVEETEAEVFCDGIRLLQDRKQQLARLREEVKVGVDQITRGECTECDEHTLREMFDTIRTEGRKRLSSDAKDAR